MKTSIVGSLLLRRTLIAAVFFLGTASVIAHGAEYWQDIRYSKDFALDYSSARAFLDGRDPYAKIRDLVQEYLDPPPRIARENILPGGNWHPPFKVLITVPFALLPYQAAGILWLLVSAGCFVVAGSLLGRTLGWSRRAALALGFGFLAVPVVQLDLSAGQLNGPMLLLLVLAWRGLKAARETHAGVALGTVVALKVFPAFLAFPLLGSKRFRVVGIAAATAVLLSVVGALVIGPDHFGSFLREGGGEEGFDYWDSSPANISWWGVVTRWLTANGWVHAADLGGVGIAIAMAFVVVFIVIALRPPSNLSGDPFWAAVPLMLLAWPIVWVHYPALALPWVVIAGAAAWTRSRTWLLAGFGLATMAMMIGFLPGLPGAAKAGIPAVAFGYQLPTLGLVGAVVLEAIGGPRRDRSQTGPWPGMNS